MRNDLIQVTCPHDGCGITFALEQGYINCRRGDHKNFYCPNGHSQLFPQETEKEKLQRELEWEKQEHLLTTKAKERLECELKKYKPKVSKKKK